jgi:hypothetical protein
MHTGTTNKAEIIQNKTIIEFEVRKNTKSLTKCLDAVIKFDTCDGKFAEVSYDEVNKFIKSENLKGVLCDGNYVISEIGVLVETEYLDGKKYKMYQHFVVRENYLVATLNYKKKIMWSVVSDRDMNTFEMECAEVKSVSCYVYLDEYKKGTGQQRFLIGTVTPDKFKTSNIGGKQKVTKEIEKNWQDAIDKVVAYRGFPSEEYIGSYLTSCKVYSLNYSKNRKANILRGLLDTPLKQSSEKQQTFLLKLLNGKYSELDVSLLNTFQCSAMIGHLTADCRSAAECDENDEKLKKLYEFLLDRQNNNIKNF